MKRAVVTGLGFITSIGNNRAAVLDSLRTGRTGIEIHPELDRPDSPIKLGGTIKGFQVSNFHPERWQLPPGLTIPRRLLRAMSPHAVYSYAAMQEAIADAALPPDLVAGERTGVLCASVGSTSMLYRHTDRIWSQGIERAHPFCLTQSIAGSLHVNLTTAFGMRGASGGFVSACAASAHAFGTGLDLIRLGRQDIVFIVGAEDSDAYTLLPFASCRALTTSTDPAISPCAFDRKRNGFVGTGGSTVIVLEDYEHARARGATVYAEAAGWSQTSDGYDVIAPEPEGKGLARAMRLALADAGWRPEQVDYVNAHATSTQAGDLAELRALKDVFNSGHSPRLSSTKSQTGHAFSAAGAMEAAFCCLAIKEGFTPMSINVTEPDPEVEGLNLVTAPNEEAPRRVLSNSSGFGGTNMVLALQQVES